MAETNTLRAVIQVVDRATGPLRQVMATASRAAAPFRSLGGLAKRIGGQESFGRLREAMGRLGTAAGGLVGHVSGLLGPLSALGAGVSVAGFGMLVQRVTSLGDEVAKTADRLGIGIERLQELRYAAGMAGVPTEQLDQSMAQLTRKMAEAAGGKNADVAALFKKLGISLKDANGQIRNAGEVLPELADAFEANGNAAVRARMASALFGEEAGMRMINFLGAGRESLEDMTAEARKYGVITTEQARSAEAFGDAQARLQTVISGLGNTVAGDLLPVLQPLVDRMTEWIAANRQLIASEVVETIKGLVAAISAIDWAGVIDGARNVGESIAAVVDFMGGWESAIVALVAAVNAPLLGAVGSVIGAMGKLAMVFTTNPVLAAVMLIAAAALLIYQNWDAISDYFTRLWAGVRELFSTAAGWIDGKLREILPAPLYEAWQGLIGWYGDLFGALVKVFGGLLDFVVGVFTGDFGGAVDGLKQAWEGIGDYFDTILAPVVGVFDSVWGSISPIIDKIQGGMSFIANSWIGRQLGFGSDEGEEGGPAPTPSGGGRGSRPSLIKAAQAAGAAGKASPARVDGEVVTRIELAGAPPGTRVSSKASGVAQPDVAVGYRMGAAVPPIR